MDIKVKYRMKYRFSHISNWLTTTVSIMKTADIGVLHSRVRDALIDKHFIEGESTGEELIDYYVEG